MEVDLRAFGIDCHGVLLVMPRCAYLDCEGFEACDRYPRHGRLGRTTDHNQDGRQDPVPWFEWGTTSHDVDVDLSEQDDTRPIMNEYLREGCYFHDDTATHDPETGRFEASYTGDDGELESWRYEPSVHPNPLVQLDGER